MANDDELGVKLLFELGNGLFLCFIGNDGEKMETGGENANFADESCVMGDFEHPELSNKFCDPSNVEISIELVVNNPLNPLLSFSMPVDPLKISY